MSSWIEPLVEHSDKSRISLRSTADRSRCATVSNPCVRSDAHRGLCRNMRRSQSIRRLRERRHRKRGQRQELVPERVRQRHRKNQQVSGREEDCKHRKMSERISRRNLDLVHMRNRQRHRDRKHSSVPEREHRWKQQRVPERECPRKRQQASGPERRTAATLRRIRRRGRARVNRSTAVPRLQARFARRMQMNR